ncbi:MAG: hypothetical protein ACYC6N_00515 [Pirellulaceae bacterium]
MITKQMHWPWLAVALLAAATGCAPAYHAYPCGCVPYGYCPEPPPPFTNYCGCPTPWAAKFHQEIPAAPAADSDDQPDHPGYSLRPDDNDFE